jgi:hypothetical protein
MDLSLVNWITNFWTWKWNNNYEPLELTIDDNVKWIFEIRSEKPVHKGIDVLPQQYITLVFSENSPYFVKFSGVPDLETYKWIYEIYIKFLKSISLAFYLQWKVKYSNVRFWSFDEFVREKSQYLIPYETFNLRYSFDNLQYIPVKTTGLIQKRRGRNSIYKRENLVDVGKWRKISHFLSRSVDLSNQDLILELLKLRSSVMLYWDRFSLLEASVILEMVFTDFVINNFSKAWISKTKIDEIKRDVTFSQILNIYVPLIIGSKRLERIKDDLNHVDALRKVRNKIVHENIKEIDRETAISWIDSGIKLYKLLIYKKA